MTIDYGLIRTLIFQNKCDLTASESYQFVSGASQTTYGIFKKALASWLPNQFWEGESHEITLALDHFAAHIRMNDVSVVGCMYRRFRQEEKFAQSQGGARLALEFHLMSLGTCYGNA